MHERAHITSLASAHLYSILEALCYTHWKTPSVTVRGCKGQHYDKARLQTETETETQESCCSAHVQSSAHIHLSTDETELVHTRTRTNYKIRHAHTHTHKCTYIFIKYHSRKRVNTQKKIHTSHVRWIILERSFLTPSQAHPQVLLLVRWCKHPSP